MLGFRVLGNIEWVMRLSFFSNLSVIRGSLKIKFFFSGKGEGFLVEVEGLVSVFF